MVNLARICDKCGKKKNPIRTQDDVVEVKLQRKSNETGGWVDMVYLDLCNDCLNELSKKINEDVKK